MTKKNEQIGSKVDEIKCHIDQFSQSYLDSVYQEMGNDMCDELANLENSPFLRGESKIWACGILFCLGEINGLFKSGELLSMTKKEFVERFEVSESSARKRSNQIKALLEIEEEMLEMLENDQLEEWLWNLVDEMNLDQDDEDDLGLAMYEDLTEKEARAVEDANLFLMTEMMKGIDEEQMAVAAKKALEISSYCTPAYMVLLDLMSEVETGLEWVDLAIISEEKALGAKNITSLQGRLADWKEADQYLELLLTKVVMLCEMGLVEEGIVVIEQILDLDQRDPKGIHPYYIHALADIGKIEEAKRELQQDVNLSVIDYAYARVFVAIAEKKLAEAKLALVHAQQIAPEVLNYLFSPEMLDESQVWEALQEENNPMAYVAKHNGFWMRSGYSDILVHLKRELKTTKNKGNKIILFPRKSD